MAATARKIAAVIRGRDITLFHRQWKTQAVGSVAARDNGDMTRILLLVLACALAADAQQAALSPYEIVKRSIDRDTRNFERFKDYTFHQFSDQKQLDKRGKVVSSDRELEEVLMLGGRPYSRLLERDGKPLSAKDSQKEQQKLDREAAKRAKETDRDRAKYEKDRLEERRFAREIPEAFNFTLLGQESIDGLPVWKIQAEPRPGFKPRERRADLLKKVRGTLWIEQAGYQWVRADIDVIGTISWGLFVLRIPAGAKIAFSQMRVNEEVWLPRQVHVRADAKLALLKTYRADVDVAYSNYRKFRAESQILDVQEVGPSELPQQNRSQVRE
jgi:hypothetical protein